MFAPAIFSHINEFRSVIRIFLTRTGVSGRHRFDSPDVLTI